LLNRELIGDAYSEGNPDLERDSNSEEDPDPEGDPDSERDSDSKVFRTSQALASLSFLHSLLS
jgi:hypothetical protein